MKDELEEIAEEIPETLEIGKEYVSFVFKLSQNLIPVLCTQELEEKGFCPIMVWLEYRCPGYEHCPEAAAATAYERICKLSRKVPRESELLVISALNGRKGPGESRKALERLSAHKQPKRIRFVKGIRGNPWPNERRPRRNWINSVVKLISEGD